MSDAGSSQLELLGPPAYRVGHHWVSNFNYDSELLQRCEFPKPLKIYDYTLAKSIYTPGVSPSTKDLLHIAEALQEAGVRHEKLNIHWWGEPEPERKELEVTRAVLAGGFAFRSTVFTETTREATDIVRELGADTVEYDIRLPPVVKDPGAVEKQLETLASTVEYAKSLGLSFAVLFVDIGRSDFEFAVHVANESIKLGAVHLQLADSYSTLSTDAMRLLCSRFRSRLAAPIEVELHAHNDFGLATANAIAAVTVGVNPEVSVNGISYRAGFPAMDEVVTALELMYGLETGIRLDQLQRLSDIVSQRTGLPRSPSKAVAGTHQFLRDNPDAQLTYLKKGPNVFPMPNASVQPSVVGGSFRVVWGHHHSRSVIRAKLEQLKLAASEDSVREIQAKIQLGLAQLKTYPQWLTEAEVDEICRGVARRSG